MVIVIRAISRKYKKCTKEEYLMQRGSNKVFLEEILYKSFFKKGVISRTSGKEDVANKYELTVNNFKWPRPAGGFLKWYLPLF